MMYVEIVRLKCETSEHRSHGIDLPIGQVHLLDHLFVISQSIAETEEWR